MRLVFLGPPGAGKGTQAARLAGKRGLQHISTGDILRTAIARGTPTGVEAKGYVDRGALAPDEIILRLVRDRLLESDVEGGWLLDGFPRNLEQARAFEALLARLGQVLDGVMFFEVGDDEVVHRLSGRRVCQTCGDTFHLVFSPPPPPADCEKGDCKVVQRSDDHEAPIRTRLRVYAEETTPLVEHYRKKGSLITIDAAQPIEEVARAVDEQVGSRG